MQVQKLIQGGLSAFFIVCFSGAALAQLAQDDPGAAPGTPVQSTGSSSIQATPASSPVTARVIETAPRALQPQPAPLAPPAPPPPTPQLALPAPAQAPLALPAPSTPRAAPRVDPAHSGMHDAPTHRANKPQAIAKPIDRCRLASPDAHASATFPSCPADLNATLERIRAGQHYPHRDDGTVFRNNEKLLPQKAEGYYHEWVHPTPGAHGPGARRVITTPGDDIYYTPDHYDTFILVER